MKFLTYIEKKNSTKGYGFLKNDRIIDIPLAAKWISDNNFDLSQASFYSDSFNDLPLLEKVKNPIVVDGDDKLIQIGKKNNWECISFR